MIGRRGLLGLGAFFLAGGGKNIKELNSFEGDMEMASSVGYNVRCGEQSGNLTAKDHLPDGLYDKLRDHQNEITDRFWADRSDGWGSSTQSMKSWSKNFRRHVEKEDIKRMREQSLNNIFDNELDEIKRKLKMVGIDYDEFMG